MGTFRPPFLTQGRLFDDLEKPTGPSLRMKSFTSDEWYTISPAQGTCSCSEFRTERGKCAHLTALGIFPRRTFFPNTHPTFSQSLSALVKSLRVRRPEEAIYWLIYLDHFKEREQRFRIARRLLIGSAEDGHSVAVMEMVRAAFPRIAKRDAPLRELVAEAIRICRLPNWWHPASGGPGYIHSCLMGERELNYSGEPRTLESMTARLVRGIETRSQSLALGSLCGLGVARVGGTRQAELVLSLAQAANHPLAQRLAAIHLSAKSALSGDSNFLGQAVWMLAGGSSPIAETAEEVSEDEVTDMLDRATERWKEPHPIPRWSVDGIHSAGNDTRFAGILPNMHAVCLAFEHYGRISTEDEWLPEFRCLDGLVIEGDSTMHQTTHFGVFPEDPQPKTNSLTNDRRPGT